MHRKQWKSNDKATTTTTTTRKKMRMCARHKSNAEMAEMRESLLSFLHEGGVQLHERSLTSVAYLRSPLQKARLYLGGHLAPPLSSPRVSVFPPV
jgi:hypothetical protein